MHSTLSQLNKEWDNGISHPLYLVVGEEPFQAFEVLQRLKGFFLKEEADSSFNYEMWDGEHLNGGALLDSLEMLPGLFGGDSRRLVCCSRFDRAPAHALETLDSYLKNPSDTTCFAMFAAKVDKRKSWYKKIDEKGVILEVNEPYERDWPRWHHFFERKIDKKIEIDAWERLKESAGGRLSLLWSEIQKMVVFIENRPVISLADIKQVANTSAQGADVFDFAESVVLGKAHEATILYRQLLKEGENEIKLLSLLVRQFRLVLHYMELSSRGVTDTKQLSSKLGVHPFLVTKLQQQARRQTTPRLSHALNILSRCDFRLKMGEGNLFEDFLMPYFSPTR